MVRAMMHSGLGDSREDPGVLATDFNRAYQIFMATMNRLPATPSQDLVERATILSSRFQAVAATMAAKNWSNARAQIDSIYTLLGAFASRVGQATPTIAGRNAQMQAEAGSSFLKQLGVTLGVTPATGTYVPQVPGGAISDWTAPTASLFLQYPWIVPAGAGILLLLLLRR